MIIKIVQILLILFSVSSFMVSYREGKDCSVSEWHRIVYHIVAAAILMVVAGLELVK